MPDWGTASSLPTRQPLSINCSPLSGHATAGNGGAAAKGLEAAVHDVAVLIHLREARANQERWAHTSRSDQRHQGAVCEQSLCTAPQLSPLPNASIMISAQLHNGEQFQLERRSPTLICSFMTSPHAGAPTRPVPTLGSLLSKLPTLRGFS